MVSMGVGRSCTLSSHEMSLLSAQLQVGEGLHHQTVLGTCQPSDLGGVSPHNLESSHHGESRRHMDSESGHHSSKGDHHSSKGDRHMDSESGHHSSSSCEERSTSNSPLSMRPGKNSMFERDSGVSSSIERDPGVSSIERDSGVSSSIERDSGTSSIKRDSGELSTISRGSDDKTVLHKNPLKWTVEEVKRWLDVMVERHSISNLDKRKFAMNGLGIAFIPKKGFVKRLGHCGVLLYQDYHRRLKSHSVM